MTVASISAPIPIDESSFLLRNFRLPYNPDAVISGMPERNEKWRDVSGDIPATIPVIVVMPERDVPGISARHCPIPTATDCSGVMSFNLLVLKSLFRES